MFKFVATTRSLFFLESNQSSRLRWRRIGAAWWEDQATRKRDVPRFFFINLKYLLHSIRLNLTGSNLKVFRRGKPMFMCFCQGDLCNAASPHHLTVSGGWQTNKQTNKQTSVWTKQDHLMRTQNTNKQSSLNHTNKHQNKNLAIKLQGYNPHNPRPCRRRSSLPLRHCRQDHLPLNSTWLVSFCCSEI